MSKGNPETPDNLVNIESGRNELPPEIIEDCQKWLGYLLMQPDFQVQHSNPGVYIREQCDVDNEDKQAKDTWTKAGMELIKKKYILAEKSNPDSRPDIFRVNVPLLARGSDEPYITREFINLVRKNPAA